MGNLISPADMGDINESANIPKEDMRYTDSSNDKTARRNMRDLEAAAEEIEKGFGPDGPDTEFGA